MLPSCSAGPSNAIRIGSKDSSENATIAEVYAAALEKQHIVVARHLRLGNSQSVMAALVRGEIDLYPEFVRVEGDEHASASHEQSRDVTWLSPAPANDSPCLATSQYAAEQHWLLSVSKCARLARKLRLAATPDFLENGSALNRLQRLYGGLEFGKVIECEPGEQYAALGRGDAEVANGFTTDPELVEDQLVILMDDKKFWPRYHVTPVMRTAVLQSNPHVRSILDRTSRALTNFAVQQMNVRLSLLHMDPRDIAEDFIAANGA